MHCRHGERRFFLCGNKSQTMKLGYFPGPAAMSGDVGLVGGISLWELEPNYK